MLADQPCGFSTPLLLATAGKGGNPDLIRESQRRRFADVTLVDKIVDLDKQWRDGMLALTAACALFACSGGAYVEALVFSTRSCVQYGAVEDRIQCSQQGDRGEAQGKPALAVSWWLEAD